jgi:hypothetical protein
MVVGCLSPDFEYFLRLAPRSNFGHTWLGVLISDLPLSLIMLWLYQSYARPGLYKAAPGLFPFREESLKERFAIGGWKQLMLIVASILLGAVTHIFWDSFTHNGSWPYAHLAWLGVTVPLPFRPMEVYDVLQYASSLVGVVILFVLWGRWLGVRGRRDAPAISGVGIVLIVVAVFAAIVRAVVAMYLPWQGHVIFVSVTVVTFMTVLWFEVVLAGVIHTRRMDAERRWNREGDRAPSGGL